MSDPINEPLSLLETILYDNTTEDFYLLDLHLARLNRSASDLRYPTPDSTYIKDQLVARVARVPLDNPQRVRLLYNIHGHITIESTSLPTGSINPIDTLNEQTIHQLNNQPPLLVTLDTRSTLTVDQPTIQHKTTHRQVYTAARERNHVGTSNIFDVVLWNPSKHVTETSIANIAIGTRTPKGSYIWKTPSLDCGLLAGVFRQHLLDTGMMVEPKITTDDLIKAHQDGDPVICFNSVRKIYKVCLNIV